MLNCTPTLPAPIARVGTCWVRNFHHSLACRPGTCSHGPVSSHFQVLRLGVTPITCTSGILAGSSFTLPGSFLGRRRSSCPSTALGQAAAGSDTYGGARSDNDRFR